METTHLSSPTETLDDGSVAGPDETGVCRRQALQWVWLRGTYKQQLQLITRVLVEGLPHRRHHEVIGTSTRRHQRNMVAAETDGAKRTEKLTAA
jgi:hypothetical protein